MRIISGSLGGRTLKTVEGEGYRPAMSKVRAALFSMLEARGTVWAGARVLDLFAGSGSLGFEALSRGAQQVCFVERDQRAAACLTDNAQRLDLPPDVARVCMQDVERFLKKRAEAPFEIIFVDPPYGVALLAPSLKSIMRSGWLAEDGMLIAEVEMGLRLPAPLPSLLPLVDRNYGQTRILIWTTQHDTLPSTPEPLTR